MAKAKDKMEKVMGEYKRGQLHSGSKKGPKVEDRRQAIAIGLSEARKAGQKVAGKKKDNPGTDNPEPRATRSMAARRGAARRGTSLTGRRSPLAKRLSGIPI
jgi:hypothetical protein